MGREIRSYRDLDVWRKSIDLVENIYRLSRKFPAEERYALASQMQRAAVSVPANIAEGHGRKGRREFIYHLSVARGSLAELESLMIISGRLDYVQSNELRETWRLAQDVGRLLNGLLRALEEKPGNTKSSPSR